MDFLVAILVFIFVITGTLALMFWRRATAAEARIALLEASLAEARAAAAVRPAPAEPEPELAEPEQEPAAAEPELAEPEPELAEPEPAVPEPRDEQPTAPPSQAESSKPGRGSKDAKKTIPLRKNRPSTRTRENPVYKQAVKMIQDALEMTRHLGFESQLDGEPSQYRLSLDLRTERDRQAATYLEHNPFACIVELQRKDDKLALVLDTKKERPR